MNLRMEDNLPEIYTESRDFQMLCRVIDVYFKGCYNRSQGMLNQLDINTCNESLLYVIANMQGFNTDMSIPSNVLRNILKVFPWCIKHKGTSAAIELATYAVMSTYKYIYNVSVEIVQNGGSGSNNDYVIRVAVAGKEDYIKYVQEVLRFIVPAGYIVQVYAVQINEAQTQERQRLEDYVSVVYGISGLVADAQYVSEFIPTENDLMQEFKKTYYNKVGLAKIIRITDNPHKKDDAKLPSITGTADLMKEVHTEGTGENKSEINLFEDGRPTIIYGNAEQRKITDGDKD